jgi:serine O-acetyltransferase
MWRELLWRLVRPLCTIVALARYGNLWGIREVIHAAPRAHPILGRVYRSHLAQKGSWIGPGARIDGRPTFPHDIFGVFISEHAVIGKNCVIFQQVTIGSETQPDSMLKGSPVIGDNVYIGAGAKIIGGITIGNNCRIGANATVTSNLPDNTLAVCAPLRKIRLKSLDNRASE